MTRWRYALPEKQRLSPRHQHNLEAWKKRNAERPDVLGKHNAKCSMCGETSRIPNISFSYACRPRCSKCGGLLDPIFKASW